MLPWIIGGLTIFAAKKVYDYYQDQEKSQPEPADNTQSQSPVRQLEAHAPLPPDWSSFLKKWFFPNEPDVILPAETEQSEQQEHKKKRRFITPSTVTLILFVMSALSIFIPAQWLTYGFITPALIKVVLFSATVGIGTNYLAILMLFKPVKPIPVLRFQGVIPAKRKEIILSMASGVRNNLLDPDTIADAIHNSGIVRKNMEMIIEGINGRLEDKAFINELTANIILQMKALILNKSYQNKMFNKIRDALHKIPITVLNVKLPDFLQTMFKRWIAAKQNSIMNFVNNELSGVIAQTASEIVELLKNIPSIYEEQQAAIENFLTKKISNAAKNFDIESIIIEKLEAMDSDEFYEMINDATNSELAILQYLGALLGAAAGLILFFVL